MRVSKATFNGEHKPVRSQLRSLADVKIGEPEATPVIAIANPKPTKHGPMAEALKPLAEKLAAPPVGRDAVLTAETICGFGLKGTGEYTKGRAHNVLIDHFVNSTVGQALRTMTGPKAGWPEACGVGTQAEIVRVLTDYLDKAKPEPETAADAVAAVVAAKQRLAGYVAAAERDVEALAKLLDEKRAYLAELRKHMGATE
jgi:hypothetical protein